MSRVEVQLFGAANFAHIALRLQLVAGEAQRLQILRAVPTEKEKWKVTKTFAVMCCLAKATCLQLTACSFSPKRL